MWPWEHVMLAYVLYSVYSRVWLLRPPSDRAALVVPVAAVLPDLIDKPLAWQFSMLPAGRSFAHSLLFALPLVVCVALVARHLGDTDAGLAFGVAYLSHLPADAIYAAIMQGLSVDLGYLVWPLRSVEPTEAGGLLVHTLELVGDFSTFVAGPGGWQFLVMEGLLVALSLLLWLADGRPGICIFRRSAVTRSGA